MCVCVYTSLVVRKIMVVGDSISRDIAGGVMGIRTAG